jgi:4-hydroxybenzoate polyprenyltransferase
VSFILLFRAWNALFAAGVCVYSFFIAGILNYGDIVLLSLGVFSLVAFANTHNDIIDFEIDKINRPNRPLPSGKINLKTANTAAFAWLFLAVILGFVAGFEFALLFTIVGALAFIYNLYLKGLPLIGNCVVALLTTTPVIIPIIKFGWPQTELLNLAFFAFMLTFVREVTKDIEDMEGDKVRGLKTFPILLGIKTSLTLIFICKFQILAQLVLFKPTLLIGIAPCLALSVLFALLKKWRLSQITLKITMLAGLVFFYITL